MSEVQTRRPTSKAKKTSTNRHNISGDRLIRQLSALTAERRFGSVTTRKARSDQASQAPQQQCCCRLENIRGGGLAVLEGSQTGKGLWQGCHKASSEYGWSYPVLCRALSFALNPLACKAARLNIVAFSPRGWALGLAQVSGLSHDDGEKVLLLSRAAPSTVKSRPKWAMPTASTPFHRTTQ